MTTPIGSLEKKELASMIAENKSFDKWYRLNYASKDEALLLKSQKDIVEIGKIQKEYDAVTEKNKNASNALSKKHQAESNALNKRQEEESSVLYEARKKEERAIANKKEKLERKLTQSGLHQEYEYNDDNEREYTWKINKSRLDDEYHDWLRELRMDMMTCLTVEDAKEIKKKFFMK